MQNDPRDKRSLSGLRLKLHEIIFEADTFAGRLFDLILIGTILMSVGITMLDSMKEMQDAYGRIFNILDWAITLFFTIEYILRLWCIGRPWKYALSFYGVIDLLAIIPTYLSPFARGAQYFSAVRILRVCRVFRVLKFTQYLGEADLLLESLKASRRRITVFLFSVLSVTIILGSVMHLVEGSTNGFTSIPRSVYWAIVTMTTVGYGDISPQTPVGQFIASMVMILGYAIIAIPTGIVTAGMISQHGANKEVSTQACRDCSAEGHDVNAKYCKYCGAQL